MAHAEPASRSQLALFEGAHVPRQAARDALLRGDLDEARAQLARPAEAAEEAADAERLRRIVASLRAAAPAGGAPAPAEAIHDAFAAGLAAEAPPGFLSEADWFAAYARCLVEALGTEPARRFRSWLGAHFAFAVGEAPSEAARRAAQAIAEREPPGPAWFEAARLAFALGEPTRAQAWLHAACLASPGDLVPEPPALEPCGVAALDAAPPLPDLPAPVVDAFDAVRALEGLPGPGAPWVAVVGEIDRVLVPPESTEEGPTAEEDPAADDRPRAFLAALRAARRSRERDRVRSPERCSDRELRARRRMQRLAPPLLDRYLRSLRGELF